MAKNRYKKKRITIVGKTNKRGEVDHLEASQKFISPDQIIVIASDVRGQVIRMIGQGEDFVVQDTFSSLISGTGNYLIKLTPTGFAGLPKIIDHKNRGKNIAVNPDKIAFKQNPNGGSVIIIETVSRALIVLETPDEIVAMVEAL